MKTLHDMFTIFDLNRIEPLGDIFDKYHSDKNSSFHDYSRQYEPLLEKYRKQKISLLEIGVLGGASLKIWREVFPNAEKIVGVDITKKCKRHNDPDNGIYVKIANATTKRFARSLSPTKFDIIIDDGSHKNNDVIKSFENLFPLLNDDGLYIVEDTVCYKATGFMDKKYPSHLEYFTKFFPYLNQWRNCDSEEGVKDCCVDPFKILKKTDDVFEYSIDKIEYGCSYIAVHKKIRHHWIKD